MTAASALTFTYDDAPVPAEQRGGKVAETNPHEDIVRALYAQVVETGSVVAKSFHIPADGKSEKVVQAEVGKQVRFLRQAGAKSTPEFTVRTKSSPSSVKAGGKTILTVAVTFWIHTTEVDGKNVPAVIKRNRGEKPQDENAADVTE